MWTRANPAFALALAAAAVFADKALYIGTWEIESEMVAPWWTERQKPDPAETKTLAGETFSIAARMHDYVFVPSLREHS